MNPLSLFNILFSVRSVPVAVPVAIPAAPVESPVVGWGRGRRPLPPHQHPLLARHDPWAEQVHHGNPNLREFPPSAVELHYASRWLTGERGALRWLRESAQSAARVAAVVALVRREGEAQGILERVAP